MLPIALGWKHGYIEVLLWLKELVTCTAWTGLRYNRELSWRRDSNLREAEEESGEVKRSGWASHFQFAASHPIPDNTASPFLTQKGSVVRGKETEVVLL